MDAVIRTYLQDHHAGSSAGVAAFDDVARQHSDEAVRAAVAAIGAEVREDQQALEDLMDAFDAKPSLVKAAATTVGEKLAHLKPNERLGTERSPLSDLWSLEALVNAVHAKGLLWKALATLDHPQLDRARLQELARRADDQHDRLEALRLAQAPKLLRR